MSKKLKIGVIFGSRSVEHEVSIVSALQVIRAVNEAGHRAVPIYITKDGQWLTGSRLSDIDSFKNISSIMSDLERVFITPDPYVNKMKGKYTEQSVKKWLGKSLPVLPPLIDMAFPVVHGTFGEEGTIQGLLELANIPYIGSGVLGSALGMDKITMKAVFKENGLPVVNYQWFLRSEWNEEREAVISKIESALKYPLFVKPSNLGSSIGISKVKNREELENALEVASNYDRRLLVEESVEDSMEINCSVAGFEKPIASVCEQPVSWEDFLNYDEKYIRGGKASGMKGAERRIPAPIPQEKSEVIRELAVKAFKSIDCRGVARIDFLINRDGDSMFINEINTIPGSVSFYLWEATGINFPQLIEKLIETAFEVHKEREKSTYSYDSKVLHQYGGAKTGNK